MAFTADQLSALETAAATGQLSVRFGDREIRYQALGDLMRAIDRARQDVQATGTRRQTRRYPEYSRG